MYELYILKGRQFTRLSFFLFISYVLFSFYSRSSCGGTDCIIYYAYILHNKAYANTASVFSLQCSTQYTCAMLNLNNIYFTNLVASPLVERKASNVRYIHIQNYTEILMVSFRMCEMEPNFILDLYIQYIHSIVQAGK